MNPKLPIESQREQASSNLQSFFGINAVIASGPMRRLMERVAKIAPTSVAVLITGETGSGKEVVARALHQYSLRCSRAWVDVNCAALPDHLLESELFGHERGAFSGADAMKQGMFELANGGTLFLDEIGELDLKMQVKLLRVLDGVPYYRLGGTRKVCTDVRIVAATNINLEDAVERGAFRRDLYHRLDQARVRVPSLKEREDDIVPLASHFLSSAFPKLHFSDMAFNALRTYDWPGNVRELRNAVIKSALAAETDEITCTDLPEEVRDSSMESQGVGRTLDDLERQAIVNALQETGGRQDYAARLLGISRRTLIRKLKVYGAQPEEAELAATA